MYNMYVGSNSEVGNIIFKYNFKYNFLVNNNVNILVYSSKL